MLRRISNDTYDTDTLDGFRLVQEDWIAGSFDAIDRNIQAIEKEFNKTYRDYGYVSEKLGKMKTDMEIIEYRLQLYFNPPKYLK